MRAVVGMLGLVAAALAIGARIRHDARTWREWDDDIDWLQEWRSA